MILFLILFALYVAVFLLGWFLRPSPVGYCKWCEQVIYEPYCDHSDHCREWLAYMDKRGEYCMRD